MSLENKTMILFTNIPTPYRIPLFNALDTECKKNNIKIYIIFASKGYERRKWKIPYESIKFSYFILSSHKIAMGNKERTLFTYSNMRTYLFRLKPDLVICSGFSFATTKMAIGRVFNNFPPFIIWTEGIYRQGYTQSWFRILQRKFSSRIAAAFLVSGTKAKMYVYSLGVQKERIFKAISTVDTDLFYDQTTRIRNKNQDPSSEKKILYVGHFTKGKRVDLLLYVFERLYTQYSNVELWLVGSGPEYLNLKNLSKNLGITRYVRFWDFQPRDKLFEFYAKADIFVFPSEYDIWGMVLVEAMASSLPCLASKAAGASIDLIQNGLNGYIVNFCQTDSIVKILLYLLKNPYTARKMGMNAAESIHRNCHIRTSVSGFMEAIKWSIQ